MSTYGGGHFERAQKMLSDGYKSNAARLLLAVTTVFAGCAGNGNGLDANGNPITPGSGGSGPLTADFQSIQDNVFTPICTRCHIGASAPEGLQLDAAHSYALLVSVPSTEQPNVLRVSPGNPDGSYIVRKLQGTAGISGGQMPLGGPYLPQSTIDVIRQWISDGAQKSATAATLEEAVKAVQRFTIATTSPDDGAIVSSPVPRLVVNFNGDVDFNLINNTNVAVTEVASGSAIPVLTSVAVPAGDPSAVLITPRMPLTNGTYRVTLRAALANLNAQSLGSDYSFTFTVDVLQ